MKPEDVARLSVPYEGDPDEPGPGPDEALGVNMPNWRMFVERLTSDLVTEPPYGIGWWASEPGTSRRILISDQLITCAQSVGANLVEASLHLLEFTDYANRESDRFADAITVEGGNFVVRPPRRNCPFEDVGPQLVRLHAIGVARALAGALDCVAGTIIGTLALPMNILRADFTLVRKSLGKLVMSLPLPEPQYVQAEVGLELERLIALTGPSGWLDWTMQFRNMLVHRGRRIEIGQLMPRQPVLLGPTGRPILRARTVTQLPLDPHRSDVEVFLDPTVTPVLTEDAGDTLRGIVDSARDLIDALAPTLLETWEWRKARPEALPQQRAQWPDGVARDSLGFVGYSPGTCPYSPSQFTTHPGVVLRMRAACLADSTRGQWATFD